MKKQLRNGLFFCGFKGLYIIFGGKVGGGRSLWAEIVVIFRVGAYILSKTMGLLSKIPIYYQKRPFYYQKSNYIIKTVTKSGPHQFHTPTAEYPVDNINPQSAE
ncbi:hypothetical protein BHE18_00645 [Rossellomorea aquimaris]|uniref:Uncharacterized protein n=1 Tax=Rossellomorea aquimaris TaxID=189382 RepID=A0A1J6X415_9BACI|nr:hypothetical protein BHE18_00645 [Rossellomorea aquimaris]